MTDKRVGPRLLVSVRSAEEAIEALSGGADVIDVKDPAAGSLGRASRQNIAEVAGAVAGRSMVTAALGELREWPEARFFEPVPGVALYKLGLSGMANEDWRERLSSWHRFLSQHDACPASLVAVAYADWREARSPHPDELFREAGRWQLGHMLLDTYRKDAGCILEMVDQETLEAWFASARQNSLKVAFAGSLRFTVSPCLIEESSQFA